MPVGNESSHIFDGVTVRGGLAVTDSLGSASVDYTRFAMGAREAILRRALGCYAETQPRTVLTGGSTLTVSGTIYGVAVGLLAGDVVSNLSVMVGTLASGFSGAGLRLGLYSKTGVQLAASVDSQASFGATGVKTIAMATPYLVVTDDAYYCAIITIATTPPVLFRGFASGNANTAAVGSGIPPAVVQTAQTDLTSPATFTATTNSISVWFGVS